MIPSAKLHGFTLVGALLLPVGCGSSDNTSNSSLGGATSTSSSGGSSGVASGGNPGAANGGTANQTGGNSGVALGGNPGAASGGMAAKGGAAGTGGVTAGVLVAPPTGKPTSCIGAGCPLGVCDDSGFFTSVACSNLYKTPIDANTALCLAGVTLGYCLEFTSATSINPDKYLVLCNTGVATTYKCNMGCGVLMGLTGTVAACT